MIESWCEMTLFERREMLWGLRDGFATHMNRIRRENFEAVKALLMERDMPASVTQPPAPSNVIYIDREAAELEQLAGMGWGML